MSFIRRWFLTTCIELLSLDQKDEREDDLVHHPDIDYEFNDTGTFTGTTIPQDVAIQRLNALRLNESKRHRHDKHQDMDNSHDDESNELDDPDDKSVRIRRRVFPGTSTNGNVQIAFLEAGKRYQNRFASIILIPGFPLTKESWVGAMRLLGRRFHVIAIDQRGYGSSSKPDPTNLANYALSNNATDLQQLILFLNLQNPILWSHSYGTQVTLQYLTMYNGGTLAPTDVILQNGFTQLPNSGNYLFSESPSQFGALGSVLQSQGYTALLNTFANTAINDQCLCSKQLNKVRAFAFLMGSTSTAAIASAVFTAVATTNLSDPVSVLSTIKQPLLAITGTVDQIINPRSSMYIGLYAGITLNSTTNMLDPTVTQPLPSVEVAEVRGAGHLIHMTHINDLVKRVVEFLIQQAAPCALEVQLNKHHVGVIKCDG